MAAVARADPAPPALAAPGGGGGASVSVAAVLQSPRCQNCHPSDARPRVGDHGRVHRMNVSRRSPEAGLPCTTCHRAENAPFPHGPPGVPDWRMPSADTPLVFQGRTVHELCEQLKDPARNGGRSLEVLREHFAHDPLVLWGWAPGPGRTLPPIAHEELMTHVDRSIAGGAVCP